jgi:hypothetical protein
MSYPGGPRSGDDPQFQPSDPAYEMPPAADPFAAVDYPDVPPQHRAAPPATFPPHRDYPTPYPRHPQTAGYQMYGPAYPPYGPVPVRTAGTNGKAIASLVCGAASLTLCLCYLPALAAIVLGAVALAEIRRTGQAGQGLAAGGMVLGALSVLVGVLVMFSGMFSGGPAG